jgi:hypothetical protein
MTRLFVDNEDSYFQTFTPFSELDEMTRMGWGDTPQVEIPVNWRHKRGPGFRVKEYTFQIKRQRFIDVNRAARGER